MIVEGYERGGKYIAMKGLCTFKRSKTRDQKERVSCDRD